MTLQEIGKQALHSRIPAGHKLGTFGNFEIKPHIAKIMHETHRIEPQIRPGRPIIACRLAPARLLWKAVDKVQLVEARHQIIEIIQISAQLRSPQEHARKNQFGRHQLPDRKLLLNDKPAAQRQQYSACQRIHCKKRNRLREGSAKMLLVCRQIARGHRVGSLQRKIEVPPGFVKAVRTANAFQPVPQRIFFPAERDAAVHGAPRPDAPDQPQQEHKQQIEKEEKWMVESRDDDANTRLQHHGEPAHHQCWHRLVDGHHLEIAVEQIRSPIILKEGVFGMNNANRDVSRQPRRKPAAENLHQIGSECV